jgi:ketosteroid isomerase-like protein
MDTGELPAIGKGLVAMKAARKNNGIRRGVLPAVLSIAVLVSWSCHFQPRKGNMDELTPRLAAETETLRELYAALNRNDIAAAIEAFDPQIDWTEPAGYPGAGTYHGHAAVKAHLAQARATWAEGRCEPERFLAAGDKVVVFVHVRVRLQQEKEWREARQADVYTFRDGKAIAMHLFADRQKALESVGIEGTAAG